ncbi:tRNA lysidine(34) synthetase TilS [Echinicola salinicaeni]|uniref:tRNA lysidine(34) synthetase TilS n=1 Tax=Echinicola salinicaeni TaxID=2762757 RepID=UPI001E33726B|nr:tRNA lysidine(34) synthetase TilS [Echinicola salinicaeni]
MNDKINQKWYFWFMLDQFIQHIRGKNLLDTSKRYLLAISGGIDSVCLAVLLKKAQINYTMLHCNFGLRGNESNGDEHFVQELAKSLKVPLYVKYFDTKAYAASQGVSTQMAARELRYHWFEEIRREEGFTGIIVGHHADDQLETILLNLQRGTGIEGVYGMSDIRDHIIRPLLPFGRKDLEEYAAKKGIAWREDSSNKESDYKRNFLRNEVLPLMKSQDPLVEDKLHQSFDRLKDTGRAFFYLYDAWLNKNVKEENQVLFMKKSVLDNVPGKKSLLYYWLRNYGFNSDQVADMLVVIEAGEVGRRFTGKSYMVNIDREYIYLGDLESRNNDLSIEKNDLVINLGKKFYDILVLEEGYSLDKNPKNAMLDRGKLDFPLQIRNWKEGDRFRPLGMKKFKKISDFLIDLKVPVIAKRETNVLCDANGEIVWVMGYRVDDRYKVSPATKEVMYLKLK